METHALNKAVLDFLMSRRSAPIPELGGPEPTPEELDTMLKAASRVPDHGKLNPWRFILYRGDMRHKVGEMLAVLAEEREGELSPARREQELTRFSRAPLVIGVVCAVEDHVKIPEWEQFLSAGMAAYNLMLAANALGFGTNMITNWYSDIPEGKELLGVAPHEKVVGFIHLGRHEGNVPDRVRPDHNELVRDYSGPWVEA
jgi:nitroreductase